MRNAVQRRESVELTQAISRRVGAPPRQRDAVLAAALCGAGAVARARAVGEEALDATARFGSCRCGGRWCMLADRWPALSRFQQQTAALNSPKISTLVQAVVRRAPVDALWRTA
ncbi:hypothetical protein ABLN85_11725 [Mycobacterium tuberculosis]